MIEWERERIIEGLSGEELERWEELGFDMTPKMVARLTHWRETRAQRERERAVEVKARKRLARQEQSMDHDRAVAKERRRRQRRLAMMASA